MTRKRSSPMGLEIYLPILLAVVMLPLLTQAAPFKDYTEIQQYTEGCYYNYNHYNEGDRIMTNEPCLNCTCHNKMLMCYLRVCPFTKPIGHDCIVEKREDQCCPIVTCPEVPVDVAHAAPEAGTGLSFPEKFGCSIDNKFYLEGAQVPSNPNRPCELCYCIKNRTSCLMQECTLHIDGCTPIYNRGSCCPVRYNCDHENDVLELEDHSTTTEASTTTITTTTVRPTSGYIIRSTMTPTVSTDCVHNNKVYADGARIASERACENCYCMRGEIVCAVRECHMPMLNDNGKICHPMPAAEGECCPSNYVCEDDAASTLSYSGVEEENILTTTAPVKDLHSAIPEEDLQLQTHIDEEETSTKSPEIEDDAGKKVAETDVVSKPSASENATKEEGAEQESVTQEVESDRVTAITSSDIKADYVTTAPVSSHTQPEAPTKLSVSKEDKENAKPAENIEEDVEIDTKVPTATNGLPESSSDYGIVTSTDKKPEIEGSYSTTEFLGSESTTVTTLPGVDKSEETNKYPHEVASEESFTGIPTVETKTDEKNKPFKSNESVTEDNVTNEEEKIFGDSTTATSSDIPMSTQILEEGQSGTRAPLIVGQQDKVSTEAPVKLFEEEQEVLEDKFDKQPTKAPTRYEQELPAAGKPDEQEIEATTTQVLGEVTVKEKGSPMEEPKVERIPEDAKKDNEEAVTLLPITLDEHGLSTGLTNEKDIDYSTANPSTFLEADDITKLPDDEHTFVTTEVEDETTSTENVPIKHKTEAYPVSDDKHKTPIVTGTPTKSEENDIAMFEEELGSGDHTTDVTPEHASEMSTVKDATSIPSDLDEDNATTKPITTVKEHESEESAESEEDNKLLDLTTTGPSKFVIISATEKTKENAEQFEITTIEPNLSDISTSAAKISTSFEGSEIYTEKPFEPEINFSSTPSDETSGKDKSEEEISSKDNIDITTAVSSVTTKVSPADKIISDEHKYKLFGETEISSTPSNESEDNKYSTKGEEIAENSTEPLATQKTIQDLDHETSTVSKTAITEEENDQKILPVSEDRKVEEHTIITDNPMLIIDDNLDSTTLKTTTQTDNRTESDTEPEEEQKSESTVTNEPSADNKLSFKEDSSTTTTIRPFSELSRVEKIPEMNLPSVIPGEGDCLVGQKTYENNSTVPASDECELVCKCISSNVVCERVKCQAPENVEKCILDEINTNKCCPTYICPTITLPPKSDESFGSTEEDKYEAPKIPQKAQESAEEAHTDKSKTNTTKPISDTFGPSVSIPEIQLPIVITEEPMSHIKSEDEFEQQTTKSSIKISEDKDDIIMVDRLSTTPSVDSKDIVIPQSITPYNTSEQEMVKSDVSELSEKKPIPAHSTDQEQPEKEFEEQIKTHSPVEHTTSSATHTPSDKKEESEITLVPTTGKYETVKPIKKEEVGGEKTKIDSSETTSTAVPIKFSPEKAMEPDTQTDKHETEEIPHHTLPDKFSNATEQIPHYNLSDQGSDAQTTLSSLTENELNAETSTTLDKDIAFSPISTISEETVAPFEGHSVKISEDTTTLASIKDHDTESDEEETTRTTIPLTEDLEEHAFTTIKQQPSTETKDHNIATEALDEKRESTSTIASVTDKSYDAISYPPEKDTTKNELYKEDVKLSTLVSKADNKILDHTVASIIPDNNVNASQESFASTIKIPISEYSEQSQPETQTYIATTEENSTAHVPLENTEKNNQEELQTVTIPVSDEKIFDYPTSDTATDTEKYSSLDEVTTEVPTHYTTEDISTPALIDLEKSDENRETVESQTDNVKQVETKETEVNPIKTVTEYTTEKNIIVASTEYSKNEPDSPTKHSLDPSVENEDTFTISTSSFENKPQLVVDHSTTNPMTSDEYTSEAITYDGDIENKIVSVSEAENPVESTTVAPGLQIESTHVPAKQPSLDLTEELSGESTESEEENSTQLVEEFTSKSPLIASTEEINLASSEESEKINDAHSTTEKTKVLGIEQQSEISTPTEHAETTNKILDEDISSFVTNAPIAENDQDLNASSPDISDQTTEKGIILNVTKSPLAGQNTEHITDKQRKGAEDTTSLEDIEHATVQQPEVDKEITDIDISTVRINNEEEVVTGLQDISSEESGTENMLLVSSTPMDASQQYESKTTTVSEALIPTENVTSKILEEKNIFDTTEASASPEEAETVSVLHSQEDSIQDLTKYNEIAHVTKQEDVKTSTVKTPLNFNKIQDVTDKYLDSTDDDSTTEKLLNELDLEEPKTTSAVLSTDVTSEDTTAHISQSDVQHSTDKQINDEVSEKDFDVLSTTNLPSEEVDLATAKPSKESEETFSVTEKLETEASTFKLPVSDSTTADIAVTEESSNEDYKDKEDVNQYRISEHVTEVITLGNQSEEEYHDHMTEMPESDEVISIKLTDIIEKSTEQAAESSDTEKDVYNEDKIAEVSTENLSEQVTLLPEAEAHENATKLSAETPLLTNHLPELPQNMTYLPPKDVESKEKIAEKKPTELPSSSYEPAKHDTELPVENVESTTEFDEVSTIKLSELATEQQNKGSHIQDETSVEETTELPDDDHVPTYKLSENITKLPAKSFESEKESHQPSDVLTWDAETATEKLPAHVTELPIQFHGTDAETLTIKEEMESQDQVTQLPIDFHGSSEKLPEHITILPFQDKDSEIAHESAENLPENLDKSPPSDVETQDDSSAEPTEKLTELPTENITPEEVITTESPIVAHELSNSEQTIEHTTENAFKIEELSKATTTQPTVLSVAAKLHPNTTVHPLFPHYTTLHSEPLDSQTEKYSSHSEAVTAKDDETFAASTTTTVSTTTSEPVTTSAPHYQSQPPIYGQPPQYGPTQYEDEYTDEDEGEVFGPGTCRYGGKLYVSAQQIPRDDPCDFCFCFRSDIICLQQSCPPPISGCHEEPISGFCCPRYECPVSMATVLNITTSTTTTSTTLPPHFLHHSYGSNAKRNGCFINGRSYRVGEKIESTSGPCINCTCGGDGKMKCDPQACVPEPTMQQVMAVVAAGRKR